MAGGSPDRAALAAALIGILRGQLPPGCRVFTSGHYMSLPSLREVLIASHRAPQLTLHRREDAGWMLVTAGAGGVLELAGVAARVAVDEVYGEGLEDAG
jgi:hypothetical protein